MANSCGSGSQRAWRPCIVCQWRTTAWSMCATGRQAAYRCTTKWVTSKRILKFPGNRTPRRPTGKLLRPAVRSWRWIFHLTRPRASFTSSTRTTRKSKSSIVRAARFCRVSAVPDTSRVNSTSLTASPWIPRATSMLPKTVARRFKSSELQVNNSRGGHRPPPTGSLEFISQYAALDEVPTLFVIVTRDDEQILFRPVKTIKPIQLSHERVFIFLNPGCVFTFYVSDSIHMPCGIPDQKVFLTGGQYHIDHL